MIPSVRRAREGDIRSIDELAVEAGLVVDAEAELGRSQARLFVIEAGGVVRGFVSAWLVAGDAEILDVAVEPGWRRAGLASALIREVLVRFAAEGATRALLEVSAENLAARRLYEALGFSLVGTRARYYSDGSDALLLQRLVSGPP